MLSSSITILLLACGQVSAEFEIRTLGGKPPVAPLQSLAADGTINLNGDITISGKEWYSIRRVAGILPDWPRAPHVELVNGDRVCGTIVGADGDVLRLRLSIPGPEQVLRFPLSAVRVVWLTRRPDDDPSWLNSPRKRDVIQSRNGDLTRAALAGMDGERKLINYQAGGKDQQLPLSRIAAIGFNTDLARARRLKGPYYRLTLADGSRLGATSIAFDGKEWAAQTLFKDTVRIPASKLMSVDLEQGKPVWLSDLKPTKYQYQSFDGEQYSWAANRCVTGDALRLRLPAGESTYDRGVGLHADCTIIYSLGGKYRRFEALAGLDARSGQKGDAGISVLVDGKPVELAKKGRLTYARGVIAISADITGAKELKIVIDRANGGNVQDHVNLVEARLIP